jgi:hypothetical protein
VAELAHSLPATGGGAVGGIDETIATLGNHTFFHNVWQGGMDGIGSNGDTQDRAEVGLFGLPEFAKPGKPTWDEASSRLIYIANNLRRMATGSDPSFGQVTAVFNLSHVASMVLIAAVDTGTWEPSCNASTPASRAPLAVRDGPERRRGLPGARPNPDKPLNCSYWEPPVVGTLQDLDHVLLANVGLWSGTRRKSQSGSVVLDELTSLLARSPLAADYTHIPPAIGGQRGDAMKYMEADLVGNPRLPLAVRFLIGNFQPLFGTATGAQLQELCIARGWGLVWALGFVGDKGGGDELNSRILDPTVSAVVGLNASLPAGADAAFRAQWAKGPPGSDLQGAWDQLQPSQLRLAPVGASTCAATDQCVGVSIPTGDCVCRSLFEARE